MSVNLCECLDTLEMIPPVWEILTAMLVSGELVEEACVFSFTFISFLSA